MSKLTKEQIPYDWLVLAIFFVVILAGSFGQSPWFIAYGTLALLARDTVYYWDLIERAWRLPSWRGNAYVWGHLILSDACYATGCYLLGRIVFNIRDMVEIIQSQF